MAETSLQPCLQPSLFCLGASLFRPSPHWPFRRTYRGPGIIRFSISSDTNKKAPGNPGLPFIGFGQPSTGAEGFPEPIPHADLLLARRVLTGMVNISLLFGKS